MTSIEGGSGLARYTLTSFGDRIYARLGQPPFDDAADESDGGHGLDLGQPQLPDRAQARTEHDPTGCSGSGRRSEIPLPKRQAGGGASSRNAVFEGTPVADAHNVYVAITDRIEMTATYVACLDAETGDDPEVGPLHLRGQRQHRPRSAGQSRDRATGS